MTNTTMPISDEMIPEPVIREQLRKILTFRLFAVSAILQDFLIYVINETISGRSNDIKEYNIAVEVLKKPVGYKPVHSGIVRVHALRLRKALHEYYNVYGATDKCVISIPKGRYVPMFKMPGLPDSKISPELKSVNRFTTREEIKIAVMPFSSFEKETAKIAFVDSIGLMLSRDLGIFPHVSLVSYFTTQLLKTTYGGIKELITEHKVEYLLTGYVQFESPKLRIFFQLIDARMHTQLFSETYYMNSNAANFLELSDLIVLRVMTGLSGFSGWKGYQMIKSSLQISGKKNKFLFNENKMVKTSIA